MSDLEDKPVPKAPSDDDPASAKPDLVIRQDDLTITARALCPILASSPLIFDRAGPVKIVLPAGTGSPQVTALTIDRVVIEAHQLSRPVLVDDDGLPEPRTLPDRAARLYLALDIWGLRPLNGITTAPLLSADGTIRAADGYDAESGMWCSNVPVLDVPDKPSTTDARAALDILRRPFRTFPFADAPTIGLDGHGTVIVDPAHAPRLDESAFIAGLLTAACRASLPLAPGLLIAAPSYSGAGTGKGLLVRAAAEIAFGVVPSAITTGQDIPELEKRLGAVLIGAAPIVFFDSVNGTALRSDLLASVLTERRVEVRPLGTSRMMRLNSVAFVAVTGNGLQLSEDLARRFIVVELDARTDDPERRQFAPGFLASVQRQRRELLGAALTVWRWGRQNAAGLAPGVALGSFEDWCRWVRDPLIALGCADPVQRLAAIKARDPMRRAIEGLFVEWWKWHADTPVKLMALHTCVARLIDEHQRGRQHVAAALGKLVGTRAAGFVLTRQEAAGKWGAATYALRRTESATADGAPIVPMVPVPQENQETDSREGGA